MLLNTLQYTGQTSTKKIKIKIKKAITPRLRNSEIAVFIKAAEQRVQKVQCGGPEFTLLLSFILDPSKHGANEISPLSSQVKWYILLIV